MILVAKAIDANTLGFKGVLKGQAIKDALLTKGTLEEGKSYAVVFDKYEIVGGNLLLVDDIEIKELKQ